MKDVLAMYGINVMRNSMCNCPFHNDTHPSMKIYQDSYYCFGCQSGGDIFSFVEAIENCTFIEAFYKLGGTSKKYDNKKQCLLVRKKLERMKQARLNTANYEAQLYTMLSQAITKCRNIIASETPYSDAWCECQNTLPWLLYLWELLYIENSKEVKIPDVIRKCKRIESI